MFLISKEEVAELKVKGSGSRVKSQVIVKLEEYLAMLPVEGAFVITKDEWTMKSKPSQAINNFSHRKGSIKTFKSATIEGEQGWLVTRIR